MLAYDIPFPFWGFSNNGVQRVYKAKDFVPFYHPPTIMLILEGKRLQTSPRGVAKFLKRYHETGGIVKFTT